LHGGSRPTEQQLWAGFGDAWSAVATLISGIAVWGLAGFGLDKLFGTQPILFVAGAVMGNFAGIYLMYVKSFGQPASPDGPAAGEPPRVRPVAGWPSASPPREPRHAP
jgi:F0F1-type ATP synthase assembly protein I